MNNQFRKRCVIVCLIIISQLINTSCTKKVYVEAPVQKTITAPENKKLKEFLKAGAEKTLNVSNTSPDEIIKTAKKYLGVAHCMGGKSFKCTDCSGLLVMVFDQHDINFPHDSEEQARYGKIISVKNQLKKGDLVFFIKSYKTNKFITHSGIYIGNNEFIHTSTRKGVIITSINDPWWNDKFIFGTRVFEN
jgi:murein DD-endopeptidase / murein LD-carboxypeptidase